MFKYLLALPVALLTATASYASVISGVDGFGVPTVPGATATVTFDGQANATFSSLSLSGVTFSGIGGNLRTDNSYPNNYNGRGARYLDNNAGGTNAIRFDFSTPVSAFAFNWGASDGVWTLTAFNASNQIIEAMSTPITRASNAGDYIGLANAGMAYATLTTTNVGDWIFIDNFTVAAGTVPEPDTLAILGLGLMGMVSLRRRKTS